MDNYLAKPIDAKRLLETIEATLPYLTIAFDQTCHGGCQQLCQ